MIPIGFLGKYPGCRCRFRKMDKNDECIVRCVKRVESCEVCAWGGNKMAERDKFVSVKAARRKVKK